MFNCTYLCLASDACLRAGTASITHTSYTSHWHICQRAVVKNRPANPLCGPRCSLKSGHKGLAWLGSASGKGDAGWRPPETTPLMDVWVIASFHCKLGKLFEAGSRLVRGW